MCVFVCTHVSCQAGTISFYRNSVLLFFFVVFFCDADSIYDIADFFFFFFAFLALVKQLNGWLFTDLVQLSHAS